MNGTLLMYATIPAKLRLTGRILRGLFTLACERSHLDNQFEKSNSELERFSSLYFRVFTRPFLTDYRGL